MAVIATFGLETLQANAAQREAVKAASEVAKNIQVGSVESGRKATKRTLKAADAVTDPAADTETPE